MVCVDKIMNLALVLIIGLCALRTVDQHVTNLAHITK